MHIKRKRIAVPTHVSLLLSAKILLLLPSHGNSTKHFNYKYKWRDTNMPKLKKKLLIIDIFVENGNFVYIQVRSRYLQEL